MAAEWMIQFDASVLKLAVFYSIFFFSSCITSNNDTNTLHDNFIFQFENALL